MDAAAQKGFSAADSYDAHRPSYNPLAVERLFNALGLDGKSRMLDLAAGTGKFTTILSSRAEAMEIVAVEPHPDMLRVLRAKELDRVDVREGNAQAIPVEDRWADALIVAQAFHWFANIESLGEFARVLRPQRGSLGLIWNVEDYNQTRSFGGGAEWERLLRELNREYTDSAPRYKDAKWQAVFGTDEAGRLFNTPLQEQLFRETVWLSDEQLWRRLNTLSHIANLSMDSRASLRERFDEILNTATDLVRNDAGDIAVHSTCHIAWTHRL